MIDQVALWIGYGFIFIGAPVFALLVFAILAWATIEVLWRRWGDMKLLNEFFRWKRDRNLAR